MLFSVDARASGPSRSKLGRRGWPALGAGMGGWWLAASQPGRPEGVLAAQGWLLCIPCPVSLIALGMTTAAGMHKEGKSQCSGSDMELVSLIASEIARDGGIAPTSRLISYNSAIRKLLRGRKLHQFLRTWPSVFGIIPGLADSNGRVCVDRVQLVDGWQKVSIEVCSLVVQLASRSTTHGESHVLMSPIPFSNVFSLDKE